MLAQARLRPRLGAGIALGYATCGEVGFEGRSDYAVEPVGDVTLPGFPRPVSAFNVIAVRG